MLWWNRWSGGISNLNKWINCPFVLQSHCLELIVCKFQAADTSKCIISIIIITHNEQAEYVVACVVCVLKKQYWFGRGHVSRTMKCETRNLWPFAFLLHKWAHSFVDKPRRQFDANNEHQCPNEISMLRWRWQQTRAKGWSKGKHCKFTAKRQKSKHSHSFSRQSSRDTSAFPICSVCDLYACTWLTRSTFIYERKFVPCHIFRLFIIFITVDSASASAFLFLLFIRQARFSSRCFFFSHLHSSFSEITETCFALSYSSFIQCFLQSRIPHLNVNHFILRFVELAVFW